jgi:hypothetical protein
MCFAVFGRATRVAEDNLKSASRGTCTERRKKMAEDAPNKLSYRYLSNMVFESLDAQLGEFSLLRASLQRLSKWPEIFDSPDWRRGVGESRKVID